MCALHTDCPNFLHFSDVHFATLQNALDNVFRELRVEGFGSERKQMEVFSKEEEGMLPRKIWNLTCSEIASGSF